MNIPLLSNRYDQYYALENMDFNPGEMFPAYFGIRSDQVNADKNWSLCGLPGNANTPSVLLLLAAYLPSLY